MQIFRDLSELPSRFRGGAVSIGNFDGVHRGHASIIGQLKSLVADSGGPAIVFTFDPHPVRLLRPELAPPPLTWTTRKATLLKSHGVDAMVVYPTDRALLELTAEEFFQQIIVEQLGVSAMVEGPNFAFGKDRGGSIEKLQSLCHLHDITLEIANPVETDGEMVSSSRIRDSLKRGNAELANRMLTEPYRVRGMVTHGVKRGSEIGFPTANLEAIDTLIPEEGVYAGAALVGNDRFAAAINIGPNPTFGEHALKFEVHVIDFTGDLYGQVLEVDILSKTRETRTFDNADQLKKQLEIDIASARAVFH